MVGGIGVVGGIGGMGGITKLLPQTGYVARVRASVVLHLKRATGRQAGKEGGGGGGGAKVGQGKLPAVTEGLAA